MKELASEIEIDATAERVWQVLTDFSAYSQWNPFIRRASGMARVGERLEVHIQPPGASAMTFRPVVLAAVAGRELRWRGKLLLPGVFDGEHCFSIEAIGVERVRFTQSEIFTGLLIPLFAVSLDKGTLRGFKEMNRALKERAEQAHD